MLDFPRHLGIHSGGMVMADRPLTECCPIEWARMENRSVLQWDKDDCAAAGLVKFDLLGLGMLTMLHLAVDLVREHEGVDVDLATIPQEPEVYALLSAADTIGVFQVESRAQMATLPRLRPEKFYDLVVEVALIRPGPIQGGSVHPYLRRRNGQEEITYPHPLLEQCLEKTLGVPLFQEQLMQMAIDVAGFTPGESDRLRQAMGSKRSRARMAAMRDRLLVGMAARGITGEVADDIVHKIEGFADFGFPESHSVSFAYLVYASSWIKLHYPAEFACALLNAQPMGFYSPHTIVRDATRHGVEVLGPCVEQSRKDCTLEPRTEAAGPVGRPGPGWHADPSIHAMRVGLRYVRGSERRAARPHRRRARRAAVHRPRRLHPAHERAHRRARSARHRGRVRVLRPRPPLRAVGRGRAARRPSRQAPRGGHRGRGPHVAGDARVRGDRGRPLGHRSVGGAPSHRAGARRSSTARGIVTAAQLRELPDRTVVDVAGVVTHRQQPSTAKGVIFLNLEDETGLINVICTPDVWKRYRVVARTAPALEIRGLLEKYQGVVNVLARRIVALPLGLTDLLKSTRTSTDAAARWCAEGRVRAAWASSRPPPVSRAVAANWFEGAVRDTDSTRRNEHRSRSRRPSPARPTGVTG